MSNHKLKNINVMSPIEMCRYKIQSLILKIKAMCFLKLRIWAFWDMMVCYLYVSAWHYEGSCHCHCEGVAVHAEQPLQQNIVCLSCIGYCWGRRQQDCWCCHSVTLHCTPPLLLWGSQTFLWNVHMYVPNKQCHTPTHSSSLILTTYWNYNIFLNRQL
jgi:hypothetical protein